MIILPRRFQYVEPPAPEYNLINYSYAGYTRFNSVGENVSGGVFRDGDESVLLTSDHVTDGVFTNTTDTSGEWILPAVVTPGVEPGDKLIDISGTDTALTGMRFKPDGTKLFLCGNEFKRVYEYSVPIPWDVSSITGLSGSYTLTNTPSIVNIEFTPDGLRMIAAESGSVKTFQEYALTTPWTITSGVSFTREYDFTDLSAIGVKATIFNPTGTKLFIGCGGTGGSRRVHEYDLSTPYDITTAVTTGFWIHEDGAAGEEITDLIFNSTGSRLYILIVSGIRQFNLIST